jgi:hypothetical protein
MCFSDIFFLILDRFYPKFSPLRFFFQALYFYIEIFTASFENIREFFGIWAHFLRPQPPDGRKKPGFTGLRCRSGPACGVAAQPLRV